MLWSRFLLQPLMEPLHLERVDLGWPCGHACGEHETQVRESRLFGLGFGGVHRHNIL